MREVRLVFTKLGRAKYISHLDINRCMGRALKRAGIPLWYTQGYNPHAYMNFSMPLPLGVESLCETMDIRIVGGMENTEIMHRLNAVLPEGIAIRRVYDGGAKAREIAWADYECRFLTQDAARAAAEIGRLLEGGGLTAVKRVKSGRRKVEKEVSLHEHIHSYSITAGDGEVLLAVRLSSGTRKNLNVNLLAGALCGGSACPIQVKSLRRSRLLTGSMEDFE